MAQDEPTMREFMMVLRDALYMIIRWIDRRYGRRTTE